MKFLGIIPARYASTRFPAKPLAMLGGKRVIERVYTQVKQVVDDHHQVTFLHEELLSKGALVGIGIGVNNEVLIAGSHIGCGPKEILAHLIGRELGRYPDITAKHLLDLVRDKVVVLLLQEGNLTVHLSVGKEIDDTLAVLGDESGKLFFIGRLDGQNHLR